jgi:excinuclease ABC subunit C
VVLKQANPRLEQLRKQVAKASTEPGIYRWLDENGRVLYVGKAKNLKKRLGSYVSPGKKNDGPWKQSFREQIADFDVTVTGSELEALLLETNLIKQLRPKYNVLMKDDKNYLFVRIPTGDPYPRVEMVRKYEKDGAKYFGPYLSSYELHQTLDMLQIALNYRACKTSIESMNRGKQPDRPCLEYQIGKCNGLCAGVISKEEYRKRVDAVIDFLKGKEKDVRQLLEQKMKAAATEKKFELAANIRNHIQRLDGTVHEKQLATDTTGENSDILGIAVLSNRAHAVVLHRRNGRLIGESHFALQGKPESIASVLEQFVPQFYDEGQEVPPMVMLPEEVDDPKVLKLLLCERRGGPVELLIPQRGRKSRLVQMAEKNAREKARQMEAKWEAEERNSKGALEDLKELLQLPSLPKRIEGYDISHLGGTETVGSMVVMKDGKAANDQYRSFTIRTLKSGQVDDYRAIQEVLTRRLRRLTENPKMEEKQWNAEGITFGKARKSDATQVQEAAEENPDRMLFDSFNPKEFLVARKDEHLAGFVRLVKLGSVMELRWAWVAPGYRGKKLGLFLIRKLLRSVKKGKIYLLCTPSLEQYYSTIGFRYIASAPKVLQEKMEKDIAEHPEYPEWKEDIFMMYDAQQNKVDPSLSAKPDLLVIDGGKGQLSTAVAALKHAGIEIPVIGLAKREEEVFVPDRKDPIPFPQESPAKFLLMRLRDEAHRFSNRHRETRMKHSAKASALDDIPGIGEDIKKQLLAAFGSLSGIRDATDEQLLTILNNSQLSSIRETFPPLTRPLQ